MMKLDKRKAFSMRLSQLIDSEFDGSQSKLAKSIGLSKSHIRNYLNGSIPLEDAREKFRNAGIDIDYIVTGKTGKIEVKEPNAEYRIKELEKEVSELKKQTVDFMNHIMKQNETISKLVEQNEQWRLRYAEIDKSSKKNMKG